MIDSNMKIACPLSFPISILCLSVFLSRSLYIFVFLSHFLSIFITLSSPRFFLFLKNISLYHLNTPWLSILLSFYLSLSVPLTFSVSHCLSLSLFLSFYLSLSVCLSLYISHLHICISLLFVPKNLVVFTPRLDFSIINPLIYLKSTI